MLSISSVVLCYQDCSNIKWKFCSGLEIAKLGKALWMTLQKDFEQVWASFKPWLQITLWLEQVYSLWLDILQNLVVESLLCPLSWLTAWMSTSFCNKTETLNDLMYFKIHERKFSRVKSLLCSVSWLNWWMSTSFCWGIQHSIISYTSNLMQVGVKSFLCSVSWLWWCLSTSFCWGLKHWMTWCPSNSCK